MDIWQALQDTHLLHATAVHFSVALGILGFPLVVVAALAKMRPPYRYAALTVYFLMALGALAGMSTGTSINIENVPLQAARSLELHAAFARYIWAPAVITVLFVLLTGVRRESLRTAFAGLATLGAALTAGLVLVATFYGQLLVYEHGLGTRARAATPAIIAPRPTPLSAPSATPDAPVPEESNMLEGIEVVAPAPAAQSPGAPNAAKTAPKAGEAPGNVADKIGALRGNARKGAPGSAQRAGTLEQKPAGVWDRGVKWFKKYLWPY